jgi:vacuolar protein sorting-associated protein 11
MISTLEQEEVPSAPVPKAATGPSYLSYLALTRGNAALGGSTETPSSPTTMAHTMTQPTGRSDSPALQGSIQEGSRTNSPRPSVTTTRLPPPVRRPSPQLYFAHFVDHPARFVRFLEAVALRRWGQSVEESSGTAPSSYTDVSDDDRSEQTAVWNTLLELYLSLSANKDSVGMSRLRDKDNRPLHNMVIRLLQNDRLPYDPTQALIVCSTHAFTPGLVLLWEKMGMYEDVLRFWMDKDKEGSDPEASTQVLRHLNIYGPTHPHLYPLVLRFLTSNSGLLSRHISDLALVLEHIDTEKIMPPLGIVQVLSRNSVASVGLVKHWLMARIQDSQNELQAVSTLENLLCLPRLIARVGSKSYQHLSS